VIPKLMGTCRRCTDLVNLFAGLHILHIFNSLSREVSKPLDDPESSAGQAVGGLKDKSGIRKGGGHERDKGGENGRNGRNGGYGGNGVVVSSNATSEPSFDSASNSSSESDSLLRGSDASAMASRCFAKCEETLVEAPKRGFEQKGQTLL
jgi:hypothetical protein